MRPTRITVLAVLVCAATACGIDAIGKLEGAGSSEPSAPSSSGGDATSEPTETTGDASNDGAAADAGADPPDDAAIDATGDADDAGIVTGPVLEITQSDPGANVNLTTEGSIDWAHFGGSGSGTATRKNIVNVISILNVVGSAGATIGASGGFPTTFDWTDGKAGTTPPTNSYLYVLDSSASTMALSVPSGPVKRTFVVWVGGNQTKGRLTATFANGALAASTSEFENQTAGYGVKFTIGYGTLTATDLTVEWKLVQAYGSDSMRFAAAALR